MRPHLTTIATNLDKISRSEREKQFYDALKGGPYAGFEEMHSAINDDPEVFDEAFLCLVAKYYALSERIFYYVWNFRQNMAVLNAIFIGLVLGGFGAYLSAPVFWVCWGSAFNQAWISYTLRPSYLRKKSKEVEGPPWAESAYESYFKLTALGPKLALAVTLLILLCVMGSPVVSAQCTPGSSCYSRAKESIWAFAVMSFLEIALPFLVLDWRILAKQLLSARLRNELSYIRKRCHEDSHQLAENITSKILKLDPLGDSIDHCWERHIDYQFDTIPGDGLCKKAFIHAKMLLESSLSVMLIMTIGLMVGGSFGTFLTQEAYWLCLAIVLLEGVMSLQLFRTRSKDNGKTMASWVLRLLTQGPLFGLMLDILLKGRYFAVEIAGCNDICRSRGKELLYVSCISLGLQCLSFLFSPLSFIGGVFVFMTIPIAVIFGLILYLIVVTPISILVCFFSQMFIIIGAGFDRKVKGKSFGTWMGFKTEVLSPREASSSLEALSPTPQSSTTQPLEESLNAV